MSNKFRAIQILERVQWFCFGAAASMCGLIACMAVLGYFAAAGVGLHSLSLCRLQKVNRGAGDGAALDSLA